jgi:hypothetical protein
MEEELVGVGAVEEVVEAEEGAQDETEEGETGSSVMVEEEEDDEEEEEEGILIGFGGKAEPPTSNENTEGDIREGSNEGRGNTKADRQPEYASFSF